MSHPVGQPDRPSRFPWPPVLLVASIAAAVALERLVIRLPVPFAEIDLVRTAGLVLAGAGLLLVLWAALEFRRHRTSIRPDRGADALLLAGPFAFSRNPIYLGEVIGLIGLGIALNRLWLVLAAPVLAIAMTRLAIVPEEAYLLRRFGEPYRDYMARVRRWL